MYRTASAPKLGRIKEISRTGLYLLTEERWPVGEVIPIKLQKEWPPQSSSDLQIDIQVRVASHGEDGVGLGFLLPAGLDPGLWEHLVKNADVQTETEHISSIFRLVRTVLFLCRLCSSGAQDSIRLLGGELDEFRTRSAVEIALRAEKLLTSEPDSERKHAHPKIVTSILKDGSWSNDDLIQQLWAGLLSRPAQWKEQTNPITPSLNCLSRLQPPKAASSLLAAERPGISSRELKENP